MGKAELLIPRPRSAGRGACLEAANAVTVDRFPFVAYEFEPNRRLGQMDYGAVMVVEIGSRITEHFQKKAI